MSRDQPTSIIGRIGSTVAKKGETRKNSQAVERQRKANLALFNSLDYEPMYASEVVPPMQRTQSPVARSYLESMLMGNNPDSTMSTRPNAAVTKATQQRQQNAMFGTPEQRVMQQRALEQKPFYEVKTPTRKVGGTDAARDKQSYIAENPDAAGIGVTRELEDAWVKQWGGKGLANDPIAWLAMKKALGNGWRPEQLAAALRGGQSLTYYQKNRNPKTGA